MNFNADTLSEIAIIAASSYAAIHRICTMIEKVAPTSRAAKIATDIDTVTTAIKNAAGIS